MSRLRLVLEVHDGLVEAALKSPSTVDYAQIRLSRLSQLDSAPTVLLDLDVTIGGGGLGQRKEVSRVTISQAEFFFYLLVQTEQEADGSDIAKTQTSWRIIPYGILWEVHHVRVDLFLEQTSNVGFAGQDLAEGDGISDCGDSCRQTSP